MEQTQWQVVQQPKGTPQKGVDIVSKRVPVPELKEGQVLIKVHWISMDPFLRGMMNEKAYGRQQTPYPRVCHALGSGVVVDSKNPDFEKGQSVTCSPGWQEYYVYDPSDFHKPKVVPEGRNLAHSVGVLGMPGATAYFGFLRICEPKEGETVAVSAASGAVGALVVQIARIQGCKVIGFAGDDEKCEYVKSLGATACINYRGKDKVQLSAAIKEVFPEGIDCYFDNTGGDISSAVHENMRQFGRISVCGQIVLYNMSEEERSQIKGVPLSMTILSKQLRIEGFMVPRWNDWEVAHSQLEKWIQEGKIDVKQDVHEGIDSAADAFLSLFRGASDRTNFGKVLVKVASE